VEAFASSAAVSAENAFSHASAVPAATLARVSEDDMPGRNRSPEPRGRQPADGDAGAL